MWPDIYEGAFGLRFLTWLFLSVMLAGSMPTAADAGVKEDYLFPAMDAMSEKAHAAKIWLRDKLPSLQRIKIPKAVINLPPPPEPEPAPVPEPAPAPEPEPVPAPEPEKKTKAEPGPEPVLAVMPPNVMPSFPVGVRRPEKPQTMLQPKLQPMPMPIPTSVKLAKNSLPSMPASTYEPSALVLGDTLRLGMVLAPQQANGCLKKGGGYIAICLLPARWPDSLRHFFDVAGTMYRGTKSIVRYDGKKATQVHILFRKEGFDSITAYVTQRYGEPTGSGTAMIVPFGNPPTENRYAMWTKEISSKSAAIGETLEVRLFDDTRGGFPDMEHGVMRLYTADSSSIFPMVNPRELMLINFSLN